MYEMNDACSIRSKNHKNPAQWQRLLKKNDAGKNKFLNNRKFIS